MAGVAAAVTMVRPKGPGEPAPEAPGRTGRTGSWKTGGHVAEAAAVLPAEGPVMTAAPGGVAVVLRRGVDLRNAAADRLTADLAGCLPDDPLRPVVEMVVELGGVDPLGPPLLTAAGRPTAVTAGLVDVALPTVDLGEILLRVVETTGGEAPPGVTDPLNVAADLADATPLRGVVDLAAVTLLRVVAAVDSAAVTHLRVGAEDTTAATLLRVVAATAAVTLHLVAAVASAAATSRPAVPRAATTVPTGGPLPAVMTRLPAAMMTEHRLPAKPNPKMAGGRSTNVNPIQHTAIFGRVQA